MSTVNSNIKIGKKDSAFFAANPTLVLLDGQLIYNEDTGELFIGDGTTQLSALSPINAGFTPSGTISEYIAGDGSYINFPTDVSYFNNDSGYIDSSAIGNTIQPYDSNTTLLGNNTAGDEIVLTTATNELTSLGLGAGESIRRNVLNTGYEGFTPLTSSDIGVTVQAYNSNTTLLGNTVTGSGSIVLATNPTISTGLTLSFLTANRIPFAGVGGALSDNAQLVWDNATTRLGVGGSPSNTSAKMEVLADTTRIIGAWLRAAPTGASFPFYCTADSAGRGFVIGSSSLTPTSSATFGMQVNVAAHGLSMSGVTNLSTGTENVISLQPGSGVVVLGGTTNAGFKLDVIGTARISGALRIGNTVHNVSPTSPDRTIEINVGGTTYYIHAKTTNN